MEVGIDKVAAIYRFILSLPFYRIVECEGRNYLLVHAGLANYAHFRSLDAYLPDELLWHGFDYDGTYYPQQFYKIIVGHTPTLLLNRDKPVSIYRGKGNVIDIDCGAVFEEASGRLGCLCLDSMQAFYV